MSTFTKRAMSLQEALAALNPTIRKLVPVDEAGGRVGTGLDNDGRRCHRCSGLGWFRWNGVRWCCFSCGIPHVDVEAGLIDVEPRNLGTTLDEWDAE